jgi:carboxymethylenebutenolidase
MIAMLKQAGRPVAVVVSVLFATMFITPAPSIRAGFTLAKAKEVPASFVMGAHTIPVWRFTPTEHTGKLPGVVLLYGMDGLDQLPKVKMLYKTVAGKISEKGYIVHFVHYFDCTPFKDDEIGPLKESLQKQLLAKDAKFDPKLSELYIKWMAAVKSGIEHLRTSENVDPDRIGVVGVSMGGFLATSLAINDPKLNVRMVANIFGALPAQQKEELAKLRTKLPPLLIMGGDDDEIVPEGMQRDLLSMWRASGNRGEALFYSGVGHVFYDKSTQAINLDLAMNNALPSAIHFLKRNMGQPAEQPMGK